MLFPFVLTVVLLCSYLVVFFLLLVLYCLPHFLRGGACDSFFFFLILVFFIVFFRFVFFCFFPPFFLFFVECVCRACRIQYDAMAWHWTSTTLLTAKQRSISTSWFCEHRACISLGLKNRHALWLCWMSTSRNIGWYNVRNTHMVVVVCHGHRP